MNLLSRVNRRLKKYNIDNGLKVSVQLILNISSHVDQIDKDHSMRVALANEAVAIALDLDCQDGFVVGLIHDVGKISLDPKLFDGHNLDKQEFEEVKWHALKSFEFIKPVNLKLAVTIGVHHPDYGLQLINFPRRDSWTTEDTSDAVINGTSLFVCDFIDSHYHRKTKLKNASRKRKKDLRTEIHNKHSLSPDHEKRLNILLDSELPLDRIIDVAREQYLELELHKATNNNAQTK